MSILKSFRAWLRPLKRHYAGHMERAREHLLLEHAFVECAGKWVAIDRRTGDVVAADSTPYALSAYLKSNKITGVDVLRAPDKSEPEMVGFG